MRVLITGAAQGIGFAIASHLGADGAIIVLNDVDKEAGKRATEQLQSMDIVATFIAGDSSKIQTINTMIEHANTLYGGIDIVIANAGITTYGDFLDYQPESLDELLAVNIKGSFFLAQAAAHQFIQQKSRGSILFMSSVTGHQAHPKLAAYGMTKAALEMLAKSLAVELAPYQIRVNAIAPGATMTDRTHGVDANYEATWKNITPSGKVCTTEDIAYAAAFMVSPEAMQITGQTLVIDGGWTSVSPPPAHPA